MTEVKEIYDIFHISKSGNSGIMNVLKLIMLSEIDSIRKNRKSQKLENNINENEFYTYDYYKNPPKDKVRKKMPFVFNKTFKIIVDFFIKRFAYEVNILLENEDYNEEFQDIDEKIMALTDDKLTSNYNISEIIININSIIHVSHNDELNNLKYVINNHIKKSKINKYSAYISEKVSVFIKVILKIYSKRFWLEKSRTINLKNLDGILNIMEIFVPNDCKTISHGLCKELYEYITYSEETEEKESKRKSAKKKDSDSDSEETEEKESKRKSAKKKDNDSDSEETEEKESKRKSAKKKDSDSDSEETEEKESKRKSAKKKDNDSDSEETEEKESKRKSAKKKSSKNRKIVIKKKKK